MAKAKPGSDLASGARYTKKATVADPVGTRLVNDEDTDPEDEDYVYPNRETPKEFFHRHLRNTIHFLMEDWFMSAMLGFITAILSIGVDVAYEYLQHYRSIIYDQAARLDRIVGFSAWVTYMVSLVALGALVCRYISKQAIGSGIPEVKVIMNGFKLQNYLTLRTLTAKMLSLVFTLGSGMPLGKEGPFVHMGAIVATLLSKITRPFQDNVFYSNEGRDMEILSSGCAVGIACTFSAPAGAVLYGIESTHKYFAVKSYWRSFFATTCAALVFRLFNSMMIAPDIAGTITAYYQTSFPNEVFVVEEIAVFALVGVMSGLAGAFFQILHKRIYRFKQRNFLFRKLFGRDGLSFTIFVAFVVSLITYPDGVGRYIAGKYTFRETLGDLISNCTMSHYNVTGAANPCPYSRIHRWSETDGPVNVLPTLFRYFSVNYVIVAIAITLALPAGIFVPSFVLGACGGRMVGEVMALLFPAGIRGPDGPQIYPGLYAVVGAAAYTGAVTHSLSIAVIVCETTGQLSPLLPVLIALMIANAVSSFLQPSIYESIISLKHVHTLKVEQIMVKDVIYITKDTTYKELRELLISTPQLRSYPLVTDDEERILLGSVARKYLNFLVTIHLGQDPRLASRRRSALSETLSNFNRNSMLQKTLSGHTLMSSSVLHEEKRLIQQNHTLGAIQKRSSDHMNGTDSALMDRAMKLEKPIDLDELAVDSAPFQLVLGTSLYKVHTLFSLLGLNHAYVTHRGQLVGVVALRELRLALADIYVRGARPTKGVSLSSVYKNSVLHHKSLAHCDSSSPDKTTNETAQTEANSDRDVEARKRDSDDTSSAISIQIHADESADSAPKRKFTVNIVDEHRANESDEGEKDKLLQKDNEKRD